VATRDVSRIGEASIDRPDRVGVHSECGTHLPDGSESGAGQEPTGVDLIGELPVDLRRDGDVRIAFDVDLSGARDGAVVGRSFVVIGIGRMSH
jgi:hypothetical protein